MPQDQEITAFEPNPGFGKSSLFEKLQCIQLLPVVPWTILRVLCRRLATNEDVGGLSIKADIIMSIIREIQWYIPLNLMRTIGTRSESRLATSKRFATVRQDLYEKVQTKDFTGYWFCKGAPGQACKPDKCDMIIYYFHGGGYRLGHPAQSLSSFLRVAEILADYDISVAVFALNYSLAPEVKWPGQVNQTVAGYRYLLEEHSIDVSKISVQGDSAGGHLVLSFFTALQQVKLPKPTATAFLISPWIDLRCSSQGSFTHNEKTDFIVRELIIRAGYSAIPRQQEEHSTESLSHMINYLTPRPNKKSWSDILPSKLWVSLGTNEVFADDIIAFAEILRADGVNVVLDATEKKAHVWQFVEDTRDLDGYFATVGKVPGNLMKGAAAYARAVMSTMET